jgi:hypothetical protein
VQRERGWVLLVLLLDGVGSGVGSGVGGGQGGEPRCIQHVGFWAGLGVDFGVHLGAERRGGLGSLVGSLVGAWGAWWGPGGRRDGGVPVRGSTSEPEGAKKTCQRKWAKNFVREKYGPDTKQTKASYLLTF